METPLEPTIIVNPAFEDAAGLAYSKAQVTAQAAHETNERLSCRMYESKFPELDALVMVNIRQIAEMGAYVHLMEYNNIEGMIPISEVSRRRIRSLQKLIRVGRNEVVVVLRVDKEKGYIDLSKRRVSPEELVKCEERYNKSRVVHGILRHVAERCNLRLEDLYIQFGWPLYKKYGHAYDAFKAAVADMDAVFDEYGLEPSLKKELVANIKKRMTPQAVKIRADIECTCFGYEGIDAIKTALLAGEACSTETVNVKIRLVAPPMYVMSTNSLDKTMGIDILEKAIVKIDESVKAAGGSLVVKMKPRAVSETDDAELAQLMAKMEKENEEISGDEEEDESGGEETNPKLLDEDEQESGDEDEA